MENDNSSGKGWALGFGLLAGIALGYYLNSNEGRAMQRKAKAQFDEYGNQINEYGTEARVKANRLYEDTRTSAQEYVTQARTTANDLSNQARVKLEESKQWASRQADTLKSTIDEQTASIRKGSKDAVDSAESSFKRGVNKAKRSIDEDRVKTEKVTKS